jgi:hypothetical protein
MITDRTHPRGTFAAELLPLSVKTKPLTMETIEVTPEMVETWQAPVFLREVTENRRVWELAQTMRSNGGVWPGVVTLGIWDGQTFIIDGQHRRRSFGLSRLPVGYVAVRYMYGASMTEMARESVQLNSMLNYMRSNERLRGLEEAIPALGQIRQICPFVAYDAVRRGTGSPAISLALVIRAWSGSDPNRPRSGGAAVNAARAMTAADTVRLTDFLTLAESAFGRGKESRGLWGALNLTLCMWLYRRLVLYPYSAKTAWLSADLFRQCLISLSADSEYPDWLVGRHLNTSHLALAYRRIKEAFILRLGMEPGKKAVLPKPTWAD